MWYELTLRPDDGTWLVTAPAFAAVVSYGASQKEACQNGPNAIEEAIAGRIADGAETPEPLMGPTGRGRFVEMSQLVFLKSALYMILRSKGMTRADLMRKLGWHREQIDRLFRLDHNSRLDQLEEAFKAIEVPLRFDVHFPAAA